MYSFSHTNIRCLFEALHETRHNSIRYTPHVHAWVGVKLNQFREYHPDAHHLFVQNKQLQKLQSWTKNFQKNVPLPEFGMH